MAFELTAKFMMAAYGLSAAGLSMAALYLGRRGGGHKEPVEDFFKRHDFPLEALEDIDVGKVSIVNGNLFPKHLISALDHAKIVYLDSLQVTKTPYPFKLVNAFASAVACVGIMPLAYLYSRKYKDDNLTCAHTPNNTENSTLISWEKEDTSRVVKTYGSYFGNDKQYDKAFNFFVMMHELRHVVQNKTDMNLNTALSREIDADLLAIKMCERFYPETKIANLVKYWRSYDGMQNLITHVVKSKDGQDYLTHDTALAIDAAQHDYEHVSDVEMARIQNIIVEEFDKVQERFYKDGSVDGMGLISHLLAMPTIAREPLAVRTIHLWAHTICMYANGIRPEEIDIEGTAPVYRHLKDRQQSAHAQPV